MLLHFLKGLSSRLHIEFGANCCVRLIFGLHYLSSRLHIELGATSIDHVIVVILFLEHFLN
jgi:hypothetical protein